MYEGACCQVGRVSVICFILSRVLARPWVAQLVGGSSSALLCCGFCSSSSVGSTYGFVMNHVFAVVAGMSLC